MAALRYRHLDTENSEIRLVSLWAGNWRDQIECNLIYVNLTLGLNYEALSYTWGDASNSREILLGGKPWQITSNLEVALRYLRYQNRPRMLWIDALCINQNDPKEKREQIPRMWKIFNSARGVVGWLGPPDDKSDEAVDSIEKMGAIFKTFNEESFGPDALSEERISKCGFDISKQDWRPIRQLLSRPYWERVWVIQELSASGIKIQKTRPFVDESEDRGSFLCGHKALSKDGFNMICLFLVLVCQSRNFLGKEPARSMIDLGSPAAVDMFGAINPPHDEFLLQLRTAAARTFKASKPQDRLYGLLGLIPRKYTAAIVPDYSIPIDELYVELFKAIITQDKTLPAIFFNRTAPDTYKPSWVSTFKEQLALGLPWFHQFSHFAAAGNTKLHARFDDLNALYVHGYRVDGLQTVIGPLAELGPPGFYDSTRPSRSPEVGLKTGFGRFLELLFQFSDNLSHPETEYLGRTLSMDMDIYDMYNPISPLPDYLLKQFQQWISGKAPFNPQNLPGPSFSNSLLRATINRCFFRANKGVMGLGPYDSKVGDVIALIAGVRHFIILRPVKKGFILVGDAYLHGSMHGELLRACLDRPDLPIEEFRII